MFALFFLQTALTDGTHWWEIYGSGRGLAAEPGLGPGLGLGSWVLGSGDRALVPNPGPEPGLGLAPGPGPAHGLVLHCVR